jgi:RNase P/RNase MRP subunit POP5
LAIDALVKSYTRRDPSSVEWRTFSDTVELDAARQEAGHHFSGNAEHATARHRFYEFTIERKSENLEYRRHLAVVSQEKASLLGAMQTANAELYLPKTMQVTKQSILEGRVNQPKALSTPER